MSVVGGFWRSLLVISTLDQALSMDTPGARVAGFLLDLVEVRREAAQLFWRHARAGLDQFQSPQDGGASGMELPRNISEAKAFHAIKAKDGHG